MLLKATVAKHYYYRWVYVATMSGLLLSLGFLGVIHPVYWQFNHQQEMLNHLQQEWQTIIKQTAILHHARHTQKNSQRETQAVNQSAVILQLQKLAQQQDLHFQSVETGAPMFVHLVLSGDYNHFLQFVRAYHELPAEIILTDFKLHTIPQDDIASDNHDNKIEFDLTMQIFNATKPSSAAIVTGSSAAPRFCNSRDGLAAIDALHQMRELQTIAMNDLRAVGYVQQYVQQQTNPCTTIKVLLLTPEKRVYVIQVGDVIGRERLRVCEINKTKIRFCSPHV